MEERFLTTNDVGVRYFVTGSGKPLLFLHGGGVEAKIYAPLFALLAKKYQVIAPDLPCFGGSSVPKTIWGFPEYATLMDRLMVELRLKDVSVLGHSFGGGIALYLSENNKKISNLILVDPVGRTQPHSPANYRFRLYVAKTFNDLFIYKRFPHILEDYKKFLCQPLQERLAMASRGRNYGEVPLFEFFKLRRDPVPDAHRVGRRRRASLPARCIFFEKNIKNATVQYVKGNHDWAIFKPKDLADIVIGNRLT